MHLLSHTAETLFCASFVSAIPTSKNGHKIALRSPTSMTPPELRAGQLSTFMAANVHAQMTIKSLKVYGDLKLRGRVTFELSLDVQEAQITHHPLGKFAT